MVYEDATDDYVRKFLEGGPKPGALGPAEQRVEDHEVEYRRRFGGELPPEGSAERQAHEDARVAARELHQREQERLAGRDEREAELDRLSSKYFIPKIELRPHLAAGMLAGELEDFLERWRELNPVDMRRSAMPSDQFEAPRKGFQADYLRGEREQARRAEMRPPSSGLGRFDPSVMSSAEFEKLQEQRRRAYVRQQLGRR